MARSKSIPGSSRTNRAKVNKEQAESGMAADSSEVGVTGQTLAEAAPAIKNGASDAVSPKDDSPERMDKSNGGSESKIDARKFEVVKTEPRKNLVPINLEDEIRRRAYEIYEQRGAGAGTEADDWFAAEREVLQRYHQHSA
jgi:hypothetical protein